MEYKLIHTKDYLLVVDENTKGFKKGEWNYNEPDNSELLYQFSYDIEEYPLGNKVLAHLPLNNNPVLEGVDLLPKLKENWVETFNKTFPCIDKLDKETQSHFKDGFMEGYKAATKTYSEEDMINIIQWCRRGSDTPFTDYLAAQERFGKEILSNEDILVLFKETRNQKLPVGFKLSNTFPNKASKTFLKSDYKTFEVDVWQGEYIY